MSTAYFSNQLQMLLNIDFSYLPRRPCLLVMPSISRMSPEEIIISEDFAVNQRDLKRLAKNFPPQTFASQWWSMTVGRPLETLGEILHSCYPNEMRAFDMYRAQFPGDVEQGISMYTWSSSMIDEHATRNERRVGNPSADSIPNMATPSTDVRCCVFVLEPWYVEFLWLQSRIVYP